VHGLHPGHRIVIAAPNGLRAVRPLFDVRFGGKKCRGAVVLRPVELDATADPWTGESHQSGLDDILPINQVIPVCFVLKDVDAPADFGEDQRFQEFILDPNSLPLAGHGVFQQSGR
jgi:hypothetical protein